MINWIIGVLVTITSGSVYDPAWQQPPWNVFIKGGHFHHEIELRIDDDAFEFRSAAFLMIGNLAPCMSPENVRAEDEDGRAVPFKIVDDVVDDSEFYTAGLGDGARRWSIQPVGKFKRAFAILDIDFVNKCSTV